MCRKKNHQEEEKGAKTDLTVGDETNPSVVDRKRNHKSKRGN